MKKVIIKFTVSNDKGTSFSETQDYSELIHEWITNGANGTKEDVLSSIKEGTFDIADISTGDIAYSYLESLTQSSRCPDFILQSDSLKIKVECLTNEYNN